MIKTILVIGYARQTQTAHQINTLQAFGAQVINLDPYGQAGVYAPLSWQGQQIHWQGQNISPQQLAGILVCAQAPEIPTQDVFNSNPQQQLDWPNWFQHFGRQRDRSDTLLGLLLAYEQAGVPMFNPPGKSTLSRRKPYQISILQAAGCQMPATLVTNDPDAARTFIRTHGECIIKPAAGGAPTLSANQLLENDGLAQLSVAPAIVQQRIVGEDLRVMVVDGEVVSCVAIGVPSGTIDFRGDRDYQQGKIHYQERKLPVAIEQQCSRAAAALGLRFTGIDLKCTDQGEYYLLECNSSPIYLDVELKLQHPITERLCRSLLYNGQVN